MLATIILAIGLVAIVEGLVLALAPSRLEDILRAISDIPPETRRLIGFAALVLGAVLIALAKSLGA